MAMLSVNKRQEITETWVEGIFWQRQQQSKSSVLGTCLDSPSNDQG